MCSAEDLVFREEQPAAAIDVAFILLELLTDKENCGKVRKRMGFKK